MAENAGRNSWFIYPLLTCTTGFGTQLWSNHPLWVVLLGVASFALGALRFWAGAQLLRSEGEQLERYHRVAVGALLATLVCWSIYATLATGLYGHEWTGLMVLMTTVGLVAGATSTLTPSYRLLLAYIAITLLPATLTLLAQNSTGARVTGATSALFIVFMATTGKQHYLRYIRLNQALVELAAARVNEAERFEQEKRHSLQLAERNEALLQAQAKAEQASRAKSVFLATMSHEIRTPMNAICGLTNLMLNTPLTSQQREWMTTLQDSGDALLALISDVLDVSKVEAGQLRLESLPFAPRPLLEELQKLLAPVAAAKNLQLVVDCAPEVPVGMLGDRLRLRQVLLNLMGNALKFSSAGTVTVDVRVQGKYLQMAVKDEGIGISSEAFEKMFKPFSQGDTATTREFGGTGLGLSICKELTALMRGQLWLSSGGQCTGDVPQGWSPPEGVPGSQFWLRLPLQACAPEQAPVLPPPPPESGERLRILVAEDNRVNQMVIRQTLVDLGHDVEVVRSGVEVLEALQRQEYSLVLMDLQMPEMDGVEATRRIRAGSGPQPWIVALTANAFHEDRTQCLAAGMNDYLSKPLRVDELRAALARSRSASPAPSVSPVH
jgi:signal transduction histidine kinase/ActR/RegA family two-component response regulator